MARKSGRLTALKVEKSKLPGMYPDGDGLYLRITPTGTKNWVLRYMLNGKPRWMGLGPVPLFGLQDARSKAIDARRLRHEGVDPIEAREAERRQRLLDAALAVTFRECAAQYIAAHRAGWKNEKHARQWSATLETYAYPKIGGLPVQAIDTALVTKIIEPIWTKKPETASRLRGRIEAVLDWATARGFRKGENPARWRGHLDKLLPAQAKIRRVKHHAAIPYTEIGIFLADLRLSGGVAAAALEFTILTAARTGETVGATWDEIDLSHATWTIPGGRMKAGRPHRVPLNRRAIEILSDRKKAAGDARKGSDAIFPAPRGDGPLSNMAMLMTLRRMGRDDLTTHGFRSAFKDWASEQTNFSREVSETALAHVVGDDTENAYRRSDLLEKRRRLMELWGNHCSKATATGTVTALRARVG